MRVTLLEAVQIEHVQQLLDSGPDGRSLPALDLKPESDVLEHIHVLEQRVVLEHEADVAVLDGDIIDPLAFDQHVARGGHFQPGDHAQHSRLAAAARAEQGHQLAFLDGEGDVVDGGYLAELFGDVF